MSPSDKKVLLATQKPITKTEFQQKSSSFVLFTLLAARVSNNSELKGAHFRILPKKVAIFAKNVRFLYYKEANKKRHLPLKVAPMCAKAHIIRNSGAK